MSCLLTEVQLRLRRRLSPDCCCRVVNWATCGAAHFIKWVSFFCRGVGGGGYFWEVLVGAHHRCHLIFTLFQSNVYKVNVRLPPCGFMSWKRTTFDVMMVWHEILTDLKWREPFNEDVFEASILRFFIVSYKRCYDDYLLGFSKTWLQISLCLWLECVCVYIHWFKRFSSYHNLSVPFSKDDRIGRF